MKRGRSLSGVELVCILCGLVAAGPAVVFGGVPHTAYGVVQYAGGSHPDSIYFSAYITIRPGEVLDISSPGCGYNSTTGQWYVQCGNFVTAWSVGNILRVEINDGGGYSGSMDVTLTNEPGDDAGVTTLTTGATYAKLTISDASVTRGSNLDLSVFMEGLGVSDSVVAYELKLGFDPDVLLALGDVTLGTMTQYWDMTISAPKETNIHIGGFSTNLPSTRLIFDAGILVKVKFLVHGIPSSQTSNTTLVRFLEGTVYTLTEEVRIAHAKSGAVTVLDGTIPTTKNVDLHPNWNLVSLGIIPDPNTLPEVFDTHDVEYVFGYRSGEGPMSWDVNRPSFLNDLKYLDGLHGYWIRSGAAAAENWSVEGDGIAVNTPIPLYSGWNLIGYLPSQEDAISHAFQSLDTLYSYIFAYEGGGGGPKSWDRNRPEFLNDLNALSPESGYWVKMNDTITLTYPTGGYINKQIIHFTSTLANQDTAPIITPYVCDFWSWGTAGIVQGDTIDVYDDDGVLCGRTDVLEENGMVGFIVHVFGDDGTTPLIDEGADNGDTLQFYINGTPADVIKGSPVWYDTSGSKEIDLAFQTGVGGDLREERLPDSIGLFGNYPNPFNAATTITYTVPFRSDTEIKVYDERGRCIRDLVDHPAHPAGAYDIIWDGRDNAGRSVSTGLYFCRLRMNERVMTRKMLLVY